MSDFEKADYAVWPRRAFTLLKSGSPALARVLQIEVRGSAPRETGADMLVSADGFFGTIGGGQLEFQVLKQARALIAQTKRHTLVQDYPLGPLLAQCCGGHVRVLIERLDASDCNWLQQAALSLEAGRAVCVRRMFEEAEPRRDIIGNAEVPAARASSTTLLPPTKSGKSSSTKVKTYGGIIEWLSQVKTPLYIFGAGHVGTALMRVLDDEVFSRHWYDDREELTDGTGGPRLLSNIDEVVGRAAPRSIFVIFTQSHDLDYALVKAVLQRGDSLYCGVIGSATKRSRFMKRLDRDGFDGGALEALTSPIGQAGLSSKTPTAIAVSVAFELFQLADQQRLDAAKSVLIEAFA